jgi:hypothetical protein
MLLANPTIDPVNDFLISLNGTGAWDTLDIAPVVSPAGAEGITCEFSAAETAQRLRRRRAGRRLFAFDGLMRRERSGWAA